MDNTRTGFVGEWEDWDWRDGTDDIDVDGTIGWDILDFDVSSEVFEAELLGVMLSVAAEHASSRSRQCVGERER